MYIRIRIFIIICAIADSMQDASETDVIINVEKKKSILLGIPKFKDLDENLDKSSSETAEGVLIEMDEILIKRKDAELERTDCIPDGKLTLAKYECCSESTVIKEIYHIPFEICVGSNRPLPHLHANIGPTDFWSR